MTKYKNKIVVAGGNGFLGRLLIRDLASEFEDWVILTRRPKTPPAAFPENVRLVEWDGRTLGQWAYELDGAEAVVNLAGRSVNCRYHARHRREILDSRIDSTRILGRAMARATVAPRTWLNAASATIYRHALDQEMDEFDGEIGKGFSVDVCRAWEKEHADAMISPTRKVAMRLAMVLDDDPDSVYRHIARLARIGLGGTMGKGDQYVSWIHGRDFTRAVLWLLRSPSLIGPVNLAAPCPIPNKDMMSLFRRAVGMPLGFPAMAPFLELGALVLRTETELILKSRRVVPRRLLDSGFEFLHAEMGTCLEDLSRRDGGKPSKLVERPV